MEDKSRMARSPMPRSKPGPRRKVKGVSAPRSVRKSSNPLPYLPAQPAAAPRPSHPSSRAEEGGEAMQSVKKPSTAPAALVQPTPADVYPRNIDAEALTANITRLIEEGGRAVAAYLRPREN